MGNDETGARLKVEVQLPTGLARRLDLAAGRSAISRAALVRAILADVLPAEETA